MCQCLNLTSKEEKTQAIYHTNLTKEIDQWWVELRYTKFLSSPMTMLTPHFILNKDLDNELVNYSAICKNNLHMFI